MFFTWLTLFQMTKAQISLVLMALALLLFALHLFFDDSFARTSIRDTNIRLRDQAEKKAEKIRLFLLDHEDKGVENDFPFAALDQFHFELNNGTEFRISDGKFLVLCERRWGRIIVRSCGGDLVHYTADAFVIAIDYQPDAAKGRIELR